MSGAGLIYIAQIAHVKSEGGRPEEVIADLVRTQGINRARLGIFPIDPVNPCEGRCVLLLLATATTPAAAEDVMAAIDAQGGVASDERSWPHALDELPRRVADRPNGQIVAFEDFETGDWDPLALLPEMPQCAPHV